jgi:hypothetical protein
VQCKSFWFLSYPRIAYFCKHPVRFSLFSSRSLEKQFLILFTLIFTFTSYIRGYIFQCCHWYSCRSESLPSSWLMDIPDTQLNSTDRSTDESQKVDAQAANLQPVMRKVSKQTRSPRGSHCVRRKTHPGREFSADRLSRRQGKISENVKKNCRTFCESLMRSIHHHCDHWAGEWHITRSAFSGRWITPHQVPAAATAQRNSGRLRSGLNTSPWTATRGWSGRGASTIGVRPDGTTRGAQAPTSRSSQTAASAHYIATSTVEHRAINWQRPDAGKSRRVNQREKIGRQNGLKEPDEADEAARGQRPDKSEKNTLRLPKSSEHGEWRHRTFKPIMIGLFIYCGGQNFYSITIAASIHISKSSRVPKTFTAYFLSHE